SDHILDFQTATSSKQNASSLRWFDLENPELRQCFEISKQLESSPPTSDTRSIVRRSNVRLLAPIPRPGKLICIGLNYRDHAAESNMKIPERPVVFSKFTTSVVGPDEPVVLPDATKKPDYEAELAVVIGRRALGVKEQQAFAYVLGYTMVNDVSAR